MAQIKIDLSQKKDHIFLPADDYEFVVVDGTVKGVEHVITINGGGGTYTFSADFIGQAVPASTASDLVRIVFSGIPEIGKILVSAEIITGEAV